MASIQNWKFFSGPELKWLKLIKQWVKSARAKKVDHEDSASSMATATRISGQPYFRALTIGEGLAADLMIGTVDFSKQYRPCTRIRLFRNRWLGKRGTWTRTKKERPRTQDYDLFPDDDHNSVQVISCSSCSSSSKNTTKIDFWKFFSEKEYLRTGKKW